MTRILITRPLAQASSFAEKLRRAGFEPHYFPVIEIRPFEDNVALALALEKLSCYDWVVFTSVNAVDIALSHPASPPAAGAWQTVRVAAIGPVTANALRARGVTPACVPDEFVAEALLPGLGDLRGKWVLLPQAEIARRVLPDAIASAGGVAHEIAVYKTLPARPDPAGLAALMSGVDIITFTSPSTVMNFVALARQNGLDPRNLPNKPLFACIGPITEQAAKEEGLSDLVVAKTYTAAGLIQAITSRESP